MEEDEGFWITVVRYDTTRLKNSTQQKKNSTESENDAAS